MSGARLKLSLEYDNASRGRTVRDIVGDLARLHWARGALIVAPDGFVIAAELPGTVAVDPLAALAASLGRELETSAARMSRPSFSTAMFSADDGTMFLSASRIGYLVVLAESQANVPAIRSALAEAVSLIEAAWAPGEVTD